MRRVKENLPDLPTDLILQIFSRLPSKSIARFRCLSKLWASLLTLGSPYFTELFMTQSRTRPRLLFGVGGECDWCRLYSCLQPQILYKNNPKQPLSVTAEFHMVLPICNPCAHISPSVSGLMCFYKRSDPNNPTLCNPSTRQIFRLPKLTKTVKNYFGYDPINKQFSVLAISCHHITSPQVYQILKLGSGTLSWKSLNCPSHHNPLKLNICINGILYYTAWLMSIWGLPYNIVCFDLNSEEFKFIDQPWDHEPELLVNFKGKLGGIKTKLVVSDKKSHLEMSLWVLEDADKQDWSEHVYNISLTELWNEEDKPYRILGVTGKGDIVLALCYTTNPFYVYFFNLEKKTLQKVAIKGFEGFKSHRIRGCVDYTEELKSLIL